MIHDLADVAVIAACCGIIYVSAFELGAIVASFVVWR